MLRPRRSVVRTRPPCGNITATSVQCRLSAARLLVAAVLSSVATSSSAVAQVAPGKAHKPSAVVFSTASSKGGAPLDSVLQSALQDLEVVQVSARPGLDLSAVQLAIDCVSETPSCLRAVASQTSAEVLIAPSIQSTPSELVVSILRFDARDNTTKRVVRRQDGSSLRSETLDAVPAMLRELFGLPPPAPKQPVATPEPTADEVPAPETMPLIEPPQDPEDVYRPMPVGPWILAGAGALVIGGGAVFGALGASNNDKFNDHPEPENEPDVHELEDLESTAKTQKTIANIMFGVGAAAMVAGGIWLIVDLAQPARRERDWRTRVSPAFGPGSVGLSVTHRGGSL